MEILQLVLPGQVNIKLVQILKKSDLYFLIGTNKKYFLNDSLKTLQNQYNFIVVKIGLV